MGTSANNQANARADWEERIDQRSQVQAQVEGTTHRAPSLPPPGSLMVESGADQVTLHWQLIYNAVGYLIHRSESQGGPFTLIDHGGGDLLAVPGPIYADTTAEPGTRYWYAVVSLADAKSTAGELSAPVEAIPKADAAVPLALSVQAQTSSRQLHAVWHMLGSEHLSQLFYGEGAGGSHTGKEFQEALRMTRTELGAEYMRAHAILHDEQGVYREVEGEARYDFTAIERIYDRLLELGLRPIIELSFLPHDLASDPTATVFTYNGIISPPRDWKRWGELNRNLAAHLVERYGIDEVRQWSFEIWNELNLKVFWTRTQDEYFRLYDIAARAIKSVDDRLQVGGPSTAAAEWITDFLNFVRQQDSPLDFISTHSYGNLPLDIEQALKAFGLEGIKVWWTEWGVSPTHFARVNDSAFGAPFILHGMKSVQGHADYLAYWVISDHFEELGRSPRLFHGGFGLLTVGNLRQPRYWALALAESMGTDLVQCDLRGDGAGSLVDVWASRKPDGTIDILAWNGTLDQSKVGGHALLNRRVNMCIEQLANRTYQCSLARVDALHSNSAALWDSQDDWPTPEQWDWLHQVNTLDGQALPDVLPQDGTAHFAIDLPMPGVILLHMTPT